MKDELIIRMIQETSAILAEMEWHQDGKAIVPSYNALLQAVQANHPEDVFLCSLLQIKTEDQVGPRELQILFTQLRIALEALQSDTINLQGK